MFIVFVFKFFLLDLDFSLDSLTYFFALEYAGLSGVWNYGFGPKLDLVSKHSDSKN